MERKITQTTMVQALSKVDSEELRRRFIDAARGRVEEAQREGSGLVMDRFAFTDSAYLVGNDAAKNEVRHRDQYEYQAGHVAERVLDELLWSWARAGAGIPTWRTDVGNHGVIIGGMRFTERGKRLLLGVPEHPLSPRFKGSLADLDEEVRARLEDAADCLVDDLLRPAVVMVGLAYETVVQDLIAAPSAMHSARLAKLRALVDGSSSMAPYEREEARVALGVAHSVADIRNRAAHPGRTEFNSTEVEEMLWKAPHWLRALRRIVGK